MIDSLLQHRQDFFRELIDNISQLTEIPVGMYENHDGQVEAVIPEASRANYEEHCKLIQSHLGGRERCEADQITRAKSCLKSNENSIVQCCWAGVYNKSVPIKIQGKSKALLVYGEMQLEGKEEESLSKHQRAVIALGLSEVQAKELKNALFKIKRHDSLSFAKLKNLLSKAESLMYAVGEEQKNAKYIVERNSHEISTRLQAVIANAENLVGEVDSKNYEQAKKFSQDVLQSAEALNTVVQSLGDYLEEYRFRRQSLGSLVDESIKIYEGEATNRGVRIVKNLAKVDWHLHYVDVSPRHLQYALNNLIQNAIKYSFHGNSNFHRYISIEGRPEQKFYCLTITNYGVGILPEEYNHIFRDGYQGKLTRKEWRTGSGKGLRFVKRTLDSHHGTIDVESILRADKVETVEGKPHVNKFTVRLPYNQPKENK